MLPVFTCAIAIGYIWSICLGVNIFGPVPSVGGNWKSTLWKALRSISLLSSCPVIYTYIYIYIYIYIHIYIHISFVFLLLYTISIDKSLWFLSFKHLK